MWSKAKKVKQTYASHTTQWAWAELDDLGWLQIKEGSSDGCTNIFMMMNSARVGNRDVRVDVDDDKFITTAMLL